MAEQKSDSGKAGAPPKASRPSSRVYSFTLTLPKLLFAVLFAALTLTWVFIFGIMLGRGHKPEERVPELARMMPSALSRNATLAPPPPAEVLKPEELKYQDSLKGRTVASAPPRPKAAESPKSHAPEPRASAKAEAAKPAPGKGTPARNAAKETAPAPAQTRPKPADKAKTAQAGDAAAGRFDYVYQVAAFKDAAPAEAMRGKLQAAGLKARVEKAQTGANTWYRLLVPFRGTPEDTRSLRATLAQQGIQRVILHSKKPLN